MAFLSSAVMFEETRSIQNEILSNASGVVINSTFHNVSREQYNIVQARLKKKVNLGRHLLLLSEFSEVKRGDIYKDPSGVCYSWQLCSNGKDDTEAAVYHAELNIAGPFGQKKFTVKTYRGRNAMKEWRRDFLRCSDSEDWCREIPLFGYNTSSVPLLIFCGELTPIAHIQVGAGMSLNLMRLYFEMLRNTLDCSVNEIWMDPLSGKFCRGPAGPKCWDAIGDFGGVKVPADVKFLKEDVLIRYLSATKYDRGFLWALNHGSLLKRAKNIRPGVYHQVISNIDDSMLAFTQNVQWMSFEDCLEEKKKVGQRGFTRFRLKDNQRRLDVQSEDPAQPWLAQASSVFHAHGIRLDEDLSLYKLVYAIFNLKGTLKKSKFKRLRRQLGKSIYFFLEHCPSPDRCFYFWSHDPTGQSSLSPDMCKYHGLPSKLSFKKAVYIQEAWPNRVYKALHDYQVTRGFDPQTTDFAQHMEYPILKVVPSENRSQEFNEGENNVASGSEQLLLEIGNTPQCLEESGDTNEQLDGSYSLEMMFDGGQVVEVVPFENQFQDFDEGENNIFESEQSLLEPDNAPQRSEEPEDVNEQLDDPYSLEMSDGGQEKEFACIPDFHSQHFLATALVGDPSAACRVMKPLRLPELFAPYARLLASSNLLLDVD